MGDTGREIERWSGFKVWLFSLISRDTRSGRVTVEQLSLKPGDRYLDIGCGLGGALEQAVAVGASAWGVDPSPAMVERAANRVPAAMVKLGSAEELPFADNEFTAVSTVASLHHWADRAAGLAEVHRVLAPGGCLLIIEKRLKGGRGHGLSPTGASGLEADLVGQGFTDTRINEISVGRHVCLGVAAIKPQSPDLQVR